MIKTLTPFHLAIPVHNIDAARAFYGGVLRLSEGRSDTRWIDFDLYGHQLVVHHVDSMNNSSEDEANTHENANPVDGKEVPVPHFGVVMEFDDWHVLVQRLKEQAVQFVIEPYIRFEGQSGEQGTMFFKDPFGNALEFKAFKDIATQLFAR